MDWGAKRHTFKRKHQSLTHLCYLDLLSSVAGNLNKFFSYRALEEGTEMDIIAHEIAHYILGDLTSGGYEAEKSADDLCEKWGFKRAYESYEAFTKKKL